MKKPITSLLIFILTLVSNSAVSQSVTANTVATVRIVGPLSLTKNVDLNFGSISASNADGMVTVAPDGTVNSFGGVTVVDSGLITAASFRVFGPPDTSFSITLPGWVELKSELNSTMSLYEVVSNPSGNGTLDANGEATLLVGASITVVANQEQGVYQGDIPVTVNLN